MNLAEFMARFADEKACEEHLIKLRWKDGFVCPNCSHTSATLVHAKHRRDADQRAPLFECTRCHRQTSVTAGTIFHKTKIPLNKWFLAVYLVANDKRGVAATTLSRHLDVSYPTAWLMLKKIRKAMAERNARYKLGGLVQVDDFYLGGVSHGDGKSGRGTDQDTVLIGVSIQRGGAPAHCFMERVDDMSAQTVSEVLSRRLAPGVTLETDGYPTYAACAKDLNVTHIVTKSSDDNAHEVFRWIDTLTSNLKKFIDGTYHGRVVYKQAYLEEYVFRFNRRTAGSGLVNRLLNACALAKPLYANSTPA
ncbi:MAG: IS1595 family transposase [Alicyclobacillus sp.]|nr:IS1595 family transposase [Alicyclobacillus sp.]